MVFFFFLIYNILMRLDKYISDVKTDSRTEAKKIIKRGFVSVNGLIVKKPEYKVHEKTDIVCIEKKEYKYQKYDYILLHKPKGYITAVKDKKHQTVMDLLDVKKDMVPVGRLDKDTEGLLLITNDGDLNHQLMSPKTHVKKLYYAEIKGLVEDFLVEEFEAGITLDKKLKPAVLQILERGEISKVYVEVVEGRYHQIKRMFKKYHLEVIYLKRIALDFLTLDNLELGEYRYLKTEEIEKLKKTRC